MVAVSFVPEPGDILVVTRNLSTWHDLPLSRKISGVQLLTPGELFVCASYSDDERKMTGVRLINGNACTIEWDDASGIGLHGWQFVFDRLTERV